jgi:hypothetical protein
MLLQDKQLSLQSFSLAELSNILILCPGYLVFKVLFLGLELLQVGQQPPDLGLQGVVVLGLGRVKRAQLLLRALNHVQLVPFCLQHFLAVLHFAPNFLQLDFPISLPLVKLLISHSLIFKLLLQSVGLNFKMLEVRAKLAILGFGLLVDLFKSIANMRGLL